MGFFCLNVRPGSCGHRVSLLAEVPPRIARTVANRHEEFTGEGFEF